MSLTHRFVLVEEDFEHDGHEGAGMAPVPPGGPGVADTPGPPAEPDTKDPPVPVAITGIPKHSAPWRQVLGRRRMMLAAELDHITDHDTRATVAGLLGVAREAATARVGIRKWWWGTEVERGWAALREAEEQIFEHRQDLGMTRVDPEVLSHAKVELKADDPLREALMSANDAEPKADETELARQQRKHLQLEALREAHAAADRNNQEARFLRNRLLIATVTCLACAAGLLVVQWRLPKSAFIDAPAGWDGSAWRLLGLVMLFGCVGSLITAIPAISAIPSDFSPFNLPLQQALLKFVAGALTAVVGMLIVTSDVVEVDTAATLAGMLVLAIAFGAGQQAVTHFVDKRAAEILEPTT